MGTEPEVNISAKPVGTAVVGVAPAILGKLLGLPQDIHILGAEWDFPANNLRVYVRGPGLPRVGIGSAAPVIYPKITRTDTDDGPVYAFVWDGVLGTPTFAER